MTESNVRRLGEETATATACQAATEGAPYVQCSMEASLYGAVHVKKLISSVRSTAYRIQGEA